jgi:hypothetical protein
MKRIAFCGTPVQLADLLRTSLEVSTVDVKLTAAPSDASNQEIAITSPWTITFDPDCPLTCKRITVRNCEVTLTNLNLRGMLSLDRAQVTLRKCRVHEATDWADYLLAANNGSHVTITDCIFEDGLRGGIVAENGSEIICTGSLFRAIRSLSTLITSESWIEAHSCTYTDCDSDCITLDSGGTATLKSCEFSDLHGRVVDSGEGCRLDMHYCKVTRCEKGVLYAWHSAQVEIIHSEISDCDYSAIFLDHTSCHLDHTKIARCNGNAVNCAHSKGVVVSDCQIRETSYPPVCVCEGSEAIVTACEIIDSRMCGVVLRTGSKATVDGTVVAGSAQFGVAVSDMSELLLRKSIVHHSQVANVCCYNHARVTIEGSFLIGPTIIGVDIFTGGSVNCLDTSIIGMSEHAIWSHLGGSGHFEGLFVSAQPVILKENHRRTIRHCSNTLFSPHDCPADHILRSDSQRPMFVELSVQKTTLECHTTAELAVVGAAALEPHCKVCGKVSTDCLFAPCAHSRYCRSCWNALKEKPTACELCLIPIDSICSPIDCCTEEDAGVCSICYANPCDSIVIPCGHTICHDCGVHWLLTNADCPFCRTPNPQIRWKISYA